MPALSRRPPVVAGPLALAATLALIATLAACRRDAAPHAERVLVAALDADPRTLDPARATDAAAQAAAGLLYDGLVALDERQVPRPALAERWEVADGGTRYVFHLRRGVRWHDGTPLTAADVAFTFQRRLLAEPVPARAGLAAALAEVRAVDDATVELRFRHPYGALLPQLDLTQAPILPQHADSGAAPIGTGPFRFASRRPGGEIRYTANRAYFGGAPWLDAVVLRELADPATQVLALEVGQVDYLFGVPGAERPRLGRDPRFTLSPSSVNPGGSNCLTTLAFNLDRPTFRDVRVRQAVAGAIDRQALVEKVLLGDGRVAAAPISSRLAIARTDGLTLPAFDTVQAARLLDATGWRREAGGARSAHGVAGVPDGTRLVVRLALLPSQAGYGEPLRTTLRALGLDLRIEQQLDAAAFARTVFARRDFDTAIGAYCQGPDPEVGVRPMLASTSIGPTPGSNMAAYREPAVDTLLDRAAAALDPEERRRLYGELQRRVARDQPYVWLVETEATRAHVARCTGFGTSPHFAATARCEERQR